MAIDFVHTAEIVEAVLAVLRGAEGDLHTGGLPASWFPATATDGETPLAILDHGDYADYPTLGDLTGHCPAILVRGLGPSPTDRAGTGGVQMTEERVRVTHIRTWEQCWTDAGEREPNMTRARERYAKIIGKALFHDPQRKLAVIAATGIRTEVELTCADGAGAQIVNVIWDGWDLGHDDGSYAVPEVTTIRELGAHLWAIACDMRVMVRSGGNA